MKKYYKVIKENFLWEIGAILEEEEHSGGEGYVPIDEVYNKHDVDEYISSHIVENSPDYFTRVYPINLVSKTIYKVKEEVKDYLSKLHTEE